MASRVKGAAPLDMLKKCRDYFAGRAEYEPTAGQRDTAKQFVKEIDATLRDWG